MSCNRGSAGAERNRPPRPVRDEELRGQVRGRPELGDRPRGRPPGPGEEAAVLVDQRAAARRGPPRRSCRSPARAWPPSASRSGRDAALQRRRRDRVMGLGGLTLTTKSGSTASSIAPTSAPIATVRRRAPPRPARRARGRGRPSRRTRRRRSRGARSAQCGPRSPAPTTTPRSGAVPLMVVKLTARTSRPATPARPARRRPPRAPPSDRVGEHPPDVGVVVDRVLLVAGAEVEDPPRPRAEAAAAAEHLAARERADEDQLVGLRDVEGLAVHLLRVDHHRMRHARAIGCAGGDGPDQLALAVVAPAQRAGGAHQAPEDLRVVRPSAAPAGPSRRAPRWCTRRRPRRTPPRAPCAPTRSARRSRRATFSGSPCSGSARVAVRTFARRRAARAAPAAIAVDAVRVDLPDLRVTTLGGHSRPIP